MPECPEVLRLIPPSSIHLASRFGVRPPLIDEVWRALRDECLDFNRS